MDLATPDNIRKLKDAGLAFAETNNALLREIAGKIADHCLTPMSASTAEPASPAQQSSPVTSTLAQ
jgi:hypothetical protein